MLLAVCDLLLLVCLSNRKTSLFDVVLLALFVCMDGRMFMFKCKTLCLKKELKRSFVRKIKIEEGILYFGHDFS